MLLRHVVPTFLATLPWVVVSQGLAAPLGPKVGAVDVPRVMAAVPAWEKAMGALRRDFEVKKNGLEAKQAELKKRQEQMEAKRTVSDAKTMAAEEQNFMQSAQEFQGELMRAQQDISQRETRLKEVMLGRIEKMVSVVAQMGDYDFVFETGSNEAPNVLYMRRGVDITADVIEAYQRTYGDQAIAGEAEKPTASSENKSQKNASQPKSAAVTTP